MGRQAFLIGQHAAARAGRRSAPLPRGVTVAPGLADWLFSAKTFAAAMIAFYIAVAFNLDRPYWCIATVYIVSQPMAGAMRAKGIYRLCGTLAGAAMAVALVPNLADAPVLLTAALCLWLGLCLYFSLCDRSPRSYLFMLAGYTAAIVGFPSVDQPGEIFVVAWARVEEISLGIVCATLIGSIIWPSPVAPRLDAAIAAYFASARRWLGAALADADGDAEAQAARREMAAAPAAFMTLTAQLAHDTSRQSVVRRPAAVLDARLAYLLPVVHGLAVHLAALRRAGGLAGEIERLLGRVVDVLTSQPGTAQPDLAPLRADIRAAARDAPAQGGTADLLRASALVRLAELLDVVADIQALWSQLLSADPRLPPLALPPGRGPDATRYRDHAIALLSAATAMLVIAMICAFWIATEWPEGSVAALMAAVLASFFAAQDDPVPQILDFLVDIAFCFFLGALYLFVVLPQVTDFTSLVLALSPFYLLLGAVPRTRSVALNGTMMMTLTAAYSADFASYINASLASASGIAGAAVVVALVRSLGADVAARRLKQASRWDIARAADGAAGVARPALAALLLDRIAALAPRLTGPDADLRLQNALRDLNVGLGILDIRQAAAARSAPMDARAGAVLALLAARYRAPASDDRALLAALDGALQEALQETPQDARAAGSAPAGRLAIALLALRLDLFPGAPVPPATGAAGGGAP